MEITERIMHPEDKSLLPLVILLGPSAVGKTELSICLAELLNMEIISADSRLLFRGMDIGTAKPDIEDRIRVPHHLIDVSLPDEIWSLARYLSAIDLAVQEVNKKGKLPILVGGSGQYIRAIVSGWNPPAIPPDGRLRAILTRWADDIGAEGLHDRLEKIDPLAAQQIDPKNVRRVVRAIEVILHSGQLFTVLRGKFQKKYDILQIGLFLPRNELYSRVDDRIALMLEMGFVQEVQTLLRDGYSDSLPSFSAIGYREIAEYINGKISRDDAIAQIKKRTRVFIRHQTNWFKPTDPNIHWIENNSLAFDNIQCMIKEWCFKTGHNM